MRDNGVVVGCRGRCVLAREQRSTAGRTHHESAGPSQERRVRREMIARACERVNGRVPVLVGITDSSFTESIALAEFAEDAGATAVVAAPAVDGPGSPTQGAAMATTSILDPGRVTTLLVQLTPTERARAVRGLAKRPVERRGVLRCVGQDRHVRRIGSVERITDSWLAIGLSS